MSRVVVGAVEPYGSQSHLTESDITYIESFSSPKRQAEVASWRELLRNTLSTNSDILYHPSGAPYIADYPGFISVSHSSTHVAIIISSSPCAIDIETVSRDFGRVASRYATSSELALPPKEEPLLLPILWSAKEVLYKLSPLDGLDLLEDLRITSFSEGEMCGVAKGCEGLIRMRYQLRDNHILVHTL